MNYDYDAIKKEVLTECSQALDMVNPEEVGKLIEAILSSEQVFFVGVGRVMLVLQSFVKRLSHIGIKTFYVGEIIEPAITSNDLLIVGSGSGETLFPVAIASKAKAFGARVAHIGSVPQNNMTKYADLFLRIPTQSRKGLVDEVRSCQPMTTLFEQCLMLLGDIICLSIIRNKAIDMGLLWRYHANLE